MGLGRLQRLNGIERTADIFAAIAVQNRDGLTFVDAIVAETEQRSAPLAHRARRNLQHRIPRNVHAPTAFDFTKHGARRVQNECDRHVAVQAGNALCNRDTRRIVGQANANEREDERKRAARPDPGKAGEHREDHGKNSASI
ncbi:MAG: hypothetical protein CBC49_007155, partial [Alphaproteobacteria bacterium TMED89]